jgi:hypothetical protein
MSAVATASCGHHRLGHRLLWVLPWPPPCGRRCGEERGGVGRERRESERGGGSGEKRGRGAVMLGYIIGTIHSLGFFVKTRAIFLSIDCWTPARTFTDPQHDAISSICKFLPTLCATLKAFLPTDCCSQTFSDQPSRANKGQ